MTKRVLGLIPARGGSKGVPRKNIRMLGGKPLLQYTTEAALRAVRLSRVVLSTEDPEIAEVGLRCGVDVPFLRPVALADDTTPTLHVVEHALAALDEEFDAVCLLQPTYPFRNPREIDSCIELLWRHKADCVITVRLVPAAYNPCWVFFSDGDGFLRLSIGADIPIPRRQDLPSAYCRDGSVYVTRCEVILQESTLYGGRIMGLPSFNPDSINIDLPEDWKRAEEIIRRTGEE